MDEVAALLEQLVENPEGAGLLPVLGDVLESRGDSRGELIAMQLGIKPSSVADAVAIGRRREELISQHTPELVQLLRGSEKVRVYSDYFQIVGLPALTAQEQSDIIEYLKLLE